MATKTKKTVKSNISKMAIVGILSAIAYIYGVQCSTDAGVY